VKNVRDSVRQILNVLNCSNRGKKRRPDEPRSDAGSHPLLPPPPARHRKMACGGGPGLPLPLRQQSARPRGQRAPHRPVHHGRYSLVEAHQARLLPAGVYVNRQGVRRQRQIAPTLHPGCLRNRRSRRRKTRGSSPRKTCGSPPDCGASMITVFIISPPFYIHPPLPGCVCITLLFQGSTSSGVCHCIHVRFI
jgi:hypothetical protein